MRLILPLIIISILCACSSEHTRYSSNEFCWTGCRYEMYTARKDSMKKWKPVNKWFDQQNFKTRAINSTDAIKLLSKVNKQINQDYKYKLDYADVWQTPDQTAALGTADCEDYAIAKMATLAHHGISTDDMYIIMSKKKKIDYVHAVLAVDISGEVYILDNEHSKIVSIDEFRDKYSIAFTMNNEGWSNTIL